MVTASSQVNWTFWTWVPIILTLVSGTLSAIAQKTVYNLDATGSCGREEFQKPYIFTLVMFLGELLCLAIYFMKVFYLKRKIRNGGSFFGQHSRANQYGQVMGVNSAPLNVSSSPAGVYSASAAQSNLYLQLESSSKYQRRSRKPPIYYYFFLSLFDLSATTVNGIGLVWVNAGLNQMLRGSMLVFCAVFAYFIIKSRPSLKQWLALGIVCVGLAIVGLAGMLQSIYDKNSNSDNGNATPFQTFLGLILIVLSSALNGLQAVLEEKILKMAQEAPNDDEVFDSTPRPADVLAIEVDEVDPLELVGWEGLFGTLISAFVMLPIVYYIPGSDCGRVEDSISTLRMFANNPVILVLSILFALSLCVMNWTSQQISQQLSAVHRNLVSATRTVLVFGVSLIMYYITENDVKPIGDPWSSWNFLELGGFVFLVGGTILYSYFGILLARQNAANQILLEEEKIVSLQETHYLPNSQYSEAEPHYVDQRAAF